MSDTATTAAVAATAGVALLYAFTTLPPSVLALLWAVMVAGGAYGGAQHGDGEQ